MRICQRNDNCIERAHCKDSVCKFVVYPNASNHKEYNISKNQTSFENQNRNNGKEDNHNIGLSIVADWSKNTSAIYNNYENHYNKIKEKDQIVSNLADLLTNTSEKVSYHYGISDRPTYSFPSCHVLNENADTWTPKTVWVRQHCEPSILPITQSAYQPTEFNSIHRCQQQSTFQHCEEASHSPNNLHTTPNEGRSIDRSKSPSHSSIISSTKELKLTSHLIQSSSTNGFYDASVADCLAIPTRVVHNRPADRPLIRTLPTFTVHEKNSPTELVSSGDRLLKELVSSNALSAILHDTCKNSAMFDKSSKLNTFDSSASTSISRILERVRSIPCKSNIEKISSTQLVRKAQVQRTSTSNRTKCVQISSPDRPNAKHNSSYRHTPINQGHIRSADGNRAESQNSPSFNSRPTITITHRFTPVGSSAPQGFSTTSNSNSRTWSSSYSKNVQSGRKESETQSSVEARIKRPMNAFMVWAKKHRPIVANVFNGLTNSQISVKLGEMWNALPKGQKQSYYDEADIIKRKHKRDFPGWVYQPRPAKKRRESKYSLANLFPSEEAMHEHMRSINHNDSFSPVRKGSYSDNRQGSPVKYNKTSDEHRVMMAEKTQKFVLEPIQVNPDNPKEYTCMMKSIDAKDPTKHACQLVHVMPILKTSSEGNGEHASDAVRQKTIQKSQMTTKDAFKLEEMSTKQECIINGKSGCSVMWSPMKANTGEKIKNLQRYTSHRPHLDDVALNFASRSITNDHDDIEADDLNYENIQQYCLESGIALEEVQLSEQSSSQTSVELDRLFYEISNSDDEDNFRECNSEWLSAPEIEITDVGDVTEL
ncbi:putative transcription factor capicua [Anneissia japonica]|uniref:putative transcription factor capicua n=1 Tax=Anneissia japonica TaxID=1529436 RepID=UPI0014256F86|nr:putative transcription factor capicua [Anneissia japonica]